MKITLEIGQDAELRKEILGIIASQVKKITGEEIKQMVSSYLSQVDIAAKVSNSLKEVINRHIDFAMKGYGSEVVKQVLDNRLKDWLEEKGVIAKEVADAVKHLVSKAVAGRLSEKLKGILEEEVGSRMQ